MPDNDWEQMADRYDGLPLSQEDIHLLYLHTHCLQTPKTESTSSRSSFLQQTTAVYFRRNKLFTEILQTDGQIIKEWK